MRRKKKDKTHIKVFITKTAKFRAIIKEPNKPSYEVTIGGESWKGGKGREHEVRILRKINDLINHIIKSYQNILIDRCVENVT